MKWLPHCLILLMTPLHGALEFETRGHAKVEWIAGSSGYDAGKPIVTAMKMVVDEGWHTYWVNPGDAGMPVAVDLELPDGWRAESLQYPMPIRFKTGELSNFGYEGTVLFPLVLHPPEDASKKVTLKASISWLACNDSACVPGEDSCSLVLDAQGGEQSSVADEIDAALKRVPAAAPDTWRLEVVSVNDGYELSLVVPDGLDLKKGKTFPRTPEVVASNAGFDWKYDPENGAWQVTVPRSEYAPTSLSSLEIAIDAPSLPRPVMVRWNAA